MWCFFFIHAGIYRPSRTVSHAEEILQVHFDAQFRSTELAQWRRASVALEHYDGSEEVL